MKDQNHAGFFLHISQGLRQFKSRFGSAVASVRNRFGNIIQQKMGPLFLAADEIAALIHRGFDKPGTLMLFALEHCGCIHVFHEHILHGGVVHCFRGDAATAEAYVGLGFALGVVLVVLYDRNMGKKAEMIYTITAYAGDALIQNKRKEVHDHG
mgnify:CR=1 FL=1